MAKTFQPRRPVAPADAPLGVRPAAGVLGIAKAEAASQKPAADAQGDGTLMVGAGIFVKGEIEACQTLVVEGRVEASLDAAELKVRRGGVFKGRAAVDSATVTGEVEGDLTVRGLLTIEPQGRVSGTIRYAEVSIRTGGQIRGDVGLIPALVADEDVA
ncbi:polymer-forming cytoskeletal protein [Pelagibius sp.]|uniref:bactofilin family protein n=1 Tax=Pelagibius sp. TaxID=1931238 RepID=UPI00261FC715|nr:polymer-forming cytoskeletal protein [Pelagibius sp.]